MPSPLAEPIDVATRSTAEFVSAWLHPGAEIVEVGCGDGQLAAELMRRGYRVLGVDADPLCVANAQSRGVKAVEAVWPRYAGPQVDAIAFTRSLHHLDPLQGSVVKAREQLTIGGTLLVEDFAFDAIERAAIRWLLGVVRSGHDRGLVAPAPDSLLSRLVEATDRTALWRRYHGDEHSVHTDEQIRASIATHLALREVTTVAYLYRYLIPYAAHSSAAAAFIAETMDDEEQRIAHGEFAPLGRRFVAVR